METIQYGLFLLGAIVCAYRAIVSKKILTAAIYLACISALVSAVLYLLMRSYEGFSGAGRIKGAYA